MHRNAMVTGLLLAIFLLASYQHLGSISQLGRSKALDFKTEEVWVFEESIHDEVNGAIAVGLQAVNVRPTFACHFRHEFSIILSSNGPDFVRTLSEDNIDNVILTTCTTSFLKHKAAIFASTANVVCVIHHSSAHDVNHELRPLMEPLAEQGRLSIMVLGEHVRERIQVELDIWAENMESTVWEIVPVEVMIPVFDYPSSDEPPEPAIFPSKAVVQGNIEPGRRNYNKLLSDLRQCFLCPLSGVSPTARLSLFTSSVSPALNTIVIPVELRDVVQVHHDLPYPEFYNLLSKADAMVPAFLERDSYQDTTSSSIAAAVITCIPVLASARHLGAYTYPKGPSVLERPISTSEVSALEAIRAQGQPRRRASGKEWQAFQDGVIQDNVEMWGRIMRHRSHLRVSGGDQEKFEGFKHVIDWECTLRRSPYIMEHDIG
ncbi:hypothetical protein IAR50_003917 [Cryptococcus sp. DSM 104548]